MSKSAEILDRVSPDRMVDDLWRLVNVPSPTRLEREAALAFAEMLADAGAEVELDETVRESPSVIGRLKGARPGGTFQLAGHIDHIYVPHPAPERDEETITGRGAADMKAGLAGILEAVRVLNETGCEFPGEVLVTVYGLHEAPVGDSRGLLRLIERGVVGDAALVAESVHSARGRAVVLGMGQAVWHAKVLWRGPGCHELNRPAEADGLLETSLRLLDALRRLGGGLGAEEADDPLAGPESLFIGEMRYGDFYNRAATECSILGTRRWGPGRTFRDVEAEVAEALRSVPCARGVSVRVFWTPVGEPYRLDPEEPVVRALRAAYERVTGRPADLAGIAAVTDANRLVGTGRVPTVLCGFESRTAHADREVVRVGELREPCRVVLLTVLNYLEER